MYGFKSRAGYGHEKLEIISHEYLMRHDIVLTPLCRTHDSPALALLASNIAHLSLFSMI